MAEATGDAHWTSPGGSKNLIFEHHMAAVRLGFGSYLRPYTRLPRFVQDCAMVHFPS